MVEADPKTLRTAYMGLVLSNLDAGSVINNTKTANLKELGNVQIETLRVISVCMKSISSRKFRNFIGI